MDNEIEVRTDYSRCVVASTYGGGGVEFELHGEGMRVLVLDDSRHGTAVLLGKEDSDYLLQELSNMSLARNQDRKGIFLGSGTTDESRNGLEIHPTNMGEPYRATVDFNVVRAGWSRLSSSTILQRDLESLVKDMSAMLGVEPATPTDTTSHGPNH